MDLSQSYDYLQLTKIQSEIASDSIVLLQTNREHVGTMQFNKLNKPIQIIKWHLNQVLEEPTIQQLTPFGIDSNIIALGIKQDIVVSKKTPCLKGDSSIFGPFKNFNFTLGIFQLTCIDNESIYIKYMNSNENPSQLTCVTNWGRILYLSFNTDTKYSKYQCVDNRWICMDRWLSVELIKMITDAKPPIDKLMNIIQTFNSNYIPDKTLLDLTVKKLFLLENNFATIQDKLTKLENQMARMELNLY
jgi:hypothetical protein